MNRFEEIRNDVGVRSKSLLVTVADILESMTRQNLEFADDFAGFAVAQLRLPTQADDFSDYRDRSKKAYSKFGTTLKGHGKDMIELLRDVPGQLKDALAGEEKPAKAKVAKKASVKKAPAKKAKAKKPATKKAPAKKAAA